MLAEIHHRYILTVEEFQKFATIWTSDDGVRKQGAMNLLQHLQQVLEGLAGVCIALLSKCNWHTGDGDGYAVSKGISVNRRCGQHNMSFYSLWGRQSW